MKKVFLPIITALSLCFTTNVFATTKHKNTKQEQTKEHKTNTNTNKTKAKKEPVIKKHIASNTNNIRYSVFNYQNGQVLEENNTNNVWPIASLTKLMTAHVFMNNIPNIKNCSASITEEDKDLTKNTKTRLSKNILYSCDKLMEVMLVASDNYAASALARSIPNWSKQDFIQHMNSQAKKMGMNETHFVDSSGLSPSNVSSIQDYKTLTMSVVKNQYISNISSQQSITAYDKNDKEIIYKNSNKLVRDLNLDVNLSKTGHINESGYNLVHLADCPKSIGVIEFGARTSEQRASFVRQKLLKYGCA